MHFLAPLGGRSNIDSERQRIEHNAIGRFGSLPRDIAVEHVAPDALGIALRRIAVTAAARGVDVFDIPGGEVEILAFQRRDDLLTIAAADQVRVTAAGLPPARPQGGFTVRSKRPW